MAKQSFTTGQVLTAAQMTSLQQTAMLGGAASAKTASYTLVAADAGTAISMSNASATTITVNTALFAAGDTVQITNLGAGVCTITAGTATVNSSASLALAQYESGTLDFTSSSAAIFIKGAGAAASSGGMTLISTTTLTGASVVLSSIPQDYKNLTFIVRNYRPADDNKHLRMRFNGNSGSSTTKYFANAATEQLNQVFDEDGFYICRPTTNTATKSLIQVTIPDYTNATTWKAYFGLSWVNNVSTTNNFDFISTQGIYKEVDAITSLTIFPTSGNFTSGTLLLYGVS